MELLMGRVTWSAILLVAMAAIFLVAALEESKADPERPGQFTQEQRSFLEREYPGGVLGRDRGVRLDSYSWCDGRGIETDIRHIGRWIVFYANGDWDYFASRECWLNLLPPKRTLSPEYQGW